MEGIEIPQGMEEEGLSKKRRVPQQKEIKKERRVCDIIGKQKKRRDLRDKVSQSKILIVPKQEKGPHTTDPRGAGAMAKGRK